MFFLFVITIFTVVPIVRSTVCETLDVRNSPDNIAEFKNCRVIKGHLMLVLMDTFTDNSDYLNGTFSELYEITDYLIIYRIMGLSSLDIVFPKLASIKGEKLFQEYSLILHDLDDLQEIGLKKLQKIEKGGVMINHCPNLCYVDTVNWTEIGVSDVKYTKPSICIHEECPRECGGACWNNYECHTPTANKCHSSCLGCTKNNSPQHCIQCKYFNNTGTCVQKCPNSTILDNYASKCVDAHQCITKNAIGTIFENVTWSVFKNACVPKCPDWYDRNAEGKCIPSEEKICPGIRITNYFDLQQIAGCTHILGSLDIVFNKDVDISDFELAFGMLVSISENLKILRSNALTSLSFFKKLRTIKGEKLWGRSYSLFVADNPNLQELFHENSSLVIEKGVPLFQNNPRLCDFEIQKKTPTEHKYNNGEECVYVLTNLNVTLVERNATNVTISWSLPKNATSVGGYRVYYIRECLANFTFVRDGFVERDENGWNSMFVTNATVFIKGLTAYTRYALFIKTNFISNATNLRTRVKYFRTAMGEPSEPTELELESQTATTITVKWQPPRYINGKLSHYILTIYGQKNYASLLDDRNYCIHPYIEDNCTCPEQEGLQFIGMDDTCIGTNNVFCNAKTVYHAESEKLRIQKRSIVDDTDDIEEYTIKVTNDTNLTFVVSGLKHFTMYVFFLQGCNFEEENEASHCGSPIMGWQRTLIQRGADFVTDIAVRTSGKNVIISWAIPKDPNFLILAYKIEYKRINSASFGKVVCQTINQLENNRSKFHIKNLDPGKYGVRIRAVSLAGTAQVAQWKYFRIAGSSTGTNWIYGFLIFLAVIVVIFLGILIWRKYKEARSADVHNFVARQHLAESEEDEWKLDEETVEIIRELEQNSVGIIYRK